MLAGTAGGDMVKTYEVGRTVGYEDGHAEGYEVGQQARYDGSHAEGYGAGYKKGYDEGFQLGLEAKPPESPPPPPERPSQSEPPLPKKDSRIFKQFKISCHKIEILALVFDLLLVVLASTFGSTIYQYVWYENFATAEACLAVGLVNGLLYIYAVSTRSLYRLPVLLVPLPFFRKLLTIFAITAFGATGSVFSPKGNVALSFWPLVATLLLQLILLVIARWIFAIATRAILSAGNLDGRRVVTIGEPAELMGLSASFLLQCFGRQEVFRVPVTMKRGCPARS
jgi:hypothetical protein